MHNTCRRYISLVQDRSYIPKLLRALKYASILTRYVLIEYRMKSHTRLLRIAKKIYFLFKIKTVTIKSIYNRKKIV